jgi:hypothetical protein
MTCIGHKRYSVLQGLSWRFQPGVVLGGESSSIEWDRMAQLREIPTA